jgi:hypothetical protein
LNSPAWYDWVELKTHWEGDETPKQTRAEQKALASEAATEFKLAA